MKLANGVLVVDNNGEKFIITVGEATKKYSGMIKLNKTAAFIAETLKNDTSTDELLGKMLEKYDVTRDDAMESINLVVGQLKKIGLIEE